LFAFGWTLMVTGFSLVLYSRLHLILPNPKVLRILLFFILGTAFIIHPPIIVATFMSGKTGQRIHNIASYFKGIFSVQEIVLSSLYIYLFVQFVRERGSEQSQEIKTTFRLLIAAQVIIIVLDVIISALLYFEFYLARKIVFTFIYAVKLKIEFLVLNCLVSFAQKSRGRQQTFDLESPLSFGSMSHGNYTDPIGPDLVMVRSGESRGRNMQLQASTFFGRRNSTEEIERRYLGRFGTSVSV